MDIAQYRLDFLLSSLKYSLMVVLMSLVWIAVQNESGNQAMSQFDQNELVMYFLFAAMLYGLSNFHTWYIEEDIKLGHLSKFLLKPMDANLYYLFYQLANSMTDLILKVIFMPLALVAFGYSLQLNPASLLIFALYIPIIFLFSFSTISTISLFAFWITDAFAIRWSVSILLRFLAGTLVPVSFFPQILQDISQYLPFQYLTYIPVQLMLQNIDEIIALRGLVILGVWTLVSLIFKKITWHYGLIKFESVGS